MDGKVPVKWGKEFSRRAGKGDPSLRDQIPSMQQQLWQQQQQQPKEQQLQQRKKKRRGATRKDRRRWLGQPGMYFCRRCFLALCLALRILGLQTTGWGRMDGEEGQFSVYGRRGQKALQLPRLRCVSCW